MEQHPLLGVVYTSHSDSMANKCCLFTVPIAMFTETFTLHVDVCTNMHQRTRTFLTGRNVNEIRLMAGLCTWNAIESVR